MFDRYHDLRFDVPDDGGSGAPPADPAPAVEEAPPADPAPVAETDPAPVTEPAPEPVNYEERITQWGGLDEVERAIELQNALATTEGVRALFEEAGAALKLPPDQIAALLGQPAPEAPSDPFQALIGDDPERLLSAQEAVDAFKQILQTQVFEPQEAQQRTAFENTVRNNVQSAFTSVLGKDYDEKVAVAVQALGDKYIHTDADLADPQKVLEAVRRGKADYDAAVTKSHGEYLKQKRDAHAELPTPVVGGFSPGSEELEEPQNVVEAGARARKRIAAAIANGNQG